MSSQTQLAKRDFPFSALTFDKDNLQGSLPDRLTPVQCADLLQKVPSASDFLF